jgi:cytochrome c553
MKVKKLVVVALIVIAMLSLAVVPALAKPAAGTPGAAPPGLHKAPAAANVNPHVVCIRCHTTKADPFCDTCH